MTEEGSGLPKLPQGWVWADLGEICATTSGGTPSRKKPAYFGGDIPWLKSGELENRLVARTEEFITEEGLANSSAKIIPRGTLLIALYGATVGKLGILAIDAAINQAICAIFTPPEIDKKYLFWFFLYYRDELLNARIGGAQPNISQRILRRVPIPLPSLAEQHRIVAKIEELFTQLDAGVAALEKAKAQLRRYRQAVLKAAVEGELTSEWREAHAQELQPVSIDADAEPPPQGWTWAKLGEICETTSGGTPSRKQPSYFDGDIPWLKSGELENGLVRCAEEFITEEGLNNSSAKIIPKDTLLIALYGATAGKVGILGIDAAINQAICAIFTPPEADTKYLFWFFRHYRDELLNARIGGAQPNLSQRILKKVQIPLPPLAEQRCIVAEVEQRLSVADEMEKTVEQSLKRAERLRQSILKRAFEGKLVPQDPSDEPASVLLERIKAEKARREGEGKGKRRSRRQRRPRQLELFTS